MCGENRLDRVLAYIATTVKCFPTLSRRFPRIITLPFEMLEFGTTNTKTKHQKQNFLQKHTWQVITKQLFDNKQNSLVHSSIYIVVVRRYCHKYKFLRTRFIYSLLSSSYKRISSIDHSAFVVAT